MCVPVGVGQRDRPEALAPAEPEPVGQHRPQRVPLPYVEPAALRPTGPGAPHGGREAVRVRVGRQDGSDVHVADQPAVAGAQLGGLRGGGGDRVEQEDVGLDGRVEYAAELPLPLPPAGRRGRPDGRGARRGEVHPAGGDHAQQRERDAGRQGPARAPPDGARTRPDPHRQLRRSRATCTPPGSGTPRRRTSPGQTSTDPATTRVQRGAAKTCVQYGPLLLATPTPISVKAQFRMLARWPGLFIQALITAAGVFWFQATFSP